MESATPGTGTATVTEREKERDKMNSVVVESLPAMTSPLPMRNQDVKINTELLHPSSKSLLDPSGHPPQDGKSVPVRCVVFSTALQDSFTTDLHLLKHAVIEADSYAILPSQTPFAHLIPAALSKLGYLHHYYTHVNGWVVLKNWQPLRLDQISNRNTDTVGDILGELSTVATLRISLARNESQTTREMKDKLLKLLLVQSRASLVSSGCPLDEGALNLMLRGDPFVVSDDTKRKFDGWYKQIQANFTRVPPAWEKLATTVPSSSTLVAETNLSDGTKSPRILDSGQTAIQPVAQSFPPCGRTRMRTSFDPEMELPRLQRWFAENPHPSRLQIQQYVKELNTLESRRGRKPLDVANIVYWFKNARAAFKRAEMRTGPAGLEAWKSPLHDSLDYSHGHYDDNNENPKERSTSMEPLDADSSSSSSGSPRSDRERCHEIGRDGERRISDAVDQDGMEIHQVKCEIKDDALDVSDAPGKEALLGANLAESLEDEHYASLNGEAHYSHSDSDVDYSDDEDKRPESRTSNCAENLSIVKREPGTCGSTSTELLSPPSFSQQQQPPTSSSLFTLKSSLGSNPHAELMSPEHLRLHELQQRYSNAATFPSTAAAMSSNAATAAAAAAMMNHHQSILSQSLVYMSPYLPNLSNLQQQSSSAHHQRLHSLSSLADERRKRNRTFIDPVTEVPLLEQWFAVNTHPSHSLVLRYTDELNRQPYRQKFPKLEPKNVQFWFKNRRAKCKRLKLSLDNPTNMIYKRSFDLDVTQ